MSKKKKWTLINTEYIRSEIVRQYATQSEFCKRFGLKESSLSEWLTDGRIPCDYDGLFLYALDIKKNKDINKFYEQELKDLLDRGVILWEK